MASNNEEGALWSIIGYLIAGLLIWGGIGFAADHWLHTHHYFCLIWSGSVLGGSKTTWVENNEQYR